MLTFKNKNEYVCKREGTLKRYLMHRPSRAAANDLRSVATPGADPMAISFEQITSAMDKHMIS